MASPREPPERAYMEVPVAPALVAALQAIVPRPLPVAAPTKQGGVLYKRARPEEEEAERALCSQHLERFVGDYLAACGWERIAFDEVRHARTACTCTLVWPWEMAVVGEGHPDAARARTCHRLDPPRAARAVRLPERWAHATMTHFVHSSAPTIPVALSSHRCNTISADGALEQRALVEFVSRVTDARTHDRFAKAARYGVACYDLDLRDVAPHVDAVLAEAQGARFLCSATFAASRRGGMLRFFVPELSDLDPAVLRQLRGFVSASPDVLTAYPAVESAECGGVVAYAPLNVADGVLRSLTIISSMTELDVLSELMGSDAQRDAVQQSLRDASYLRTYGMCAGVAPSAWAYRIALCQCMADVSGQALDYAEMSPSAATADMIMVSESMYTFSPNQPAVMKPLQSKAGTRLLLWTGRLWAMH